MRTLALALAVTFAVASPAAAAPKLEVIAKLIDRPNAGYCGDRAVRAIVRFEVETVVAGEYKAANLYVGVLCPELMAVGSRYQLTLSPLPAKHQYTDSYGEPDVPRYRAMASKKL